jgi:transposase
MASLSERCWRNWITEALVRRASANNNWVENQIRPIALGRNDWLSAGSLRAGKRAAAVMSLVHSARINGHDPYAYLKNVLERLPTQQASRFGELLPHRWTPCPRN